MKQTAATWAGAIFPWPKKGLPAAAGRSWHKLQRHTSGKMDSRAANQAKRERKRAQGLKFTLLPRKIKKMSRFHRNNLVRAIVQRQEKMQEFKKKGAIWFDREMMKARAMVAEYGRVGK